MWRRKSLPPGPHRPRALRAARCLPWCGPASRARGRRRAVPGVPWAPMRGRMRPNAARPRRRSLLLQREGVAAQHEDRTGALSSPARCRCGSSRPACPARPPPWNAGLPKSFRRAAGRRPRVLLPPPAGPPRARSVRRGRPESALTAAVRRPSRRPCRESAPCAAQQACTAGTRSSARPRISAADPFGAHPGNCRGSGSYPAPCQGPRQRTAGAPRQPYRGLEVPAPLRGSTSSARRGNSRSAWRAPKWSRHHSDLASRHADHVRARETTVVEPRVMAPSDPSRSAAGAIEWSGVGWSPRHGAPCGGIAAFHQQRCLAGTTPAEGRRAGGARQDDRAG